MASSSRSAPAPDRRVLALFGPTASGKTAVAGLLRDRLGADVVSADSAAVYAGLPIITAAPSYPTLLVGVVPLDREMSVGAYQRLAHEAVDSVARPLVVGGTGLYLRAALAELDLRPPPPEGVRERWEAELIARGPEALHAHLAAEAPWAAERIDRRDRHRIVRALELLDQDALEPPEGPNRLWTDDTRHPTLLLGLTMDRTALYALIEERVDAMVAAGAVEEVRRAQAAGASETARAALGFTELLGGDVEAMKRHTRNLARRQLTWMRKLAGVQVLDVTGRSAEDVAASIDCPPP